jgi:hypothetical protein
MEKNEIGKEIEKYAYRAVNEVFNLVVANLPKGRIIEHGKIKIHLKEQITSNVQRLLCDAYTEILNDGSWWYKSNLTMLS